MGRGSLVAAVEDVCWPARWPDALLSRCWGRLVATERLIPGPSATIPALRGSLKFTFRFFLSMAGRISSMDQVRAQVVRAG